MLHPEARPCTAMWALAVGIVCWMVGAVSGAQLPAAVDAIHVPSAGAGGAIGGATPAAETASLPIVVVTGATGRTGSLMYAGLRDSGKVVVRAFVHSNVTEARRILNCSACDESDGVYYGDVTNVTTLLPVMAGASAVACGIGATEAQPETLEEAIEFRGVENQVVALANQTGSLPPSSLKFVHISSMGTAQRTPAPYEGGTDLFWKLQGEAFLLSANLGSVVVIKPCGLGDGPAGAVSLVTGHDDAMLATDLGPIARADVAAVAVAAMLAASTPATLRMDLCSTPGPPTAPAEVLKSAQWPWQK